MTNTAPADVMEFLEAIEAGNKWRNQEILSELSAAANALNRVGIEPVILKGTAHLLAGVYSRLSDRFMLDLDLLVEDGRFRRAADTLLAAGFSADASNKPLELRITHHYPPLRRPGQIEIELHRYLGLGVCRKMLTAAEVVRDSTLCVVGGARVRIPSPEHLVVHHVMHSQLQHGPWESVAPSLRAMTDCLLLSRRFGTTIPWTRIDERFREHGERGTLLVYLSEVHDTLGMENTLVAPLGLVNRLRKSRRRLLRRWGALRHLDLVYLAGVLFGYRLGRLPLLFETPGGIGYLLRRPFTLQLYRDLWADFKNR